MPLEETTYRQGVVDKLDSIQESIAALDVKVTYTNGKVRKVIVALILVFGILIGQSFPTAHDVINLFSNVIHL